MEENPTDNMPLHTETKGEDIEENKEDISVPTPFETDQERKPLPLPSLHKTASLYRLPIPLTCHPQEVNGDKPLKLKDPGSFMVNINIEGKMTTQAMFDLGAGINIVPYSTYLQLRLGKIKPILMALQLADGSIKHLKGIVEDLLVQMDKFKVLMDFVVLEMKEAPLKHKEHMILLGRPFMAITKMVIDVQNGKLTMIVLDETV